MSSVFSRAGHRAHRLSMEERVLPYLLIEYSEMKASLLAGSFITAVGTSLAVAGEWRIPDETVGYAITVAGIIAAIALGIAAVCVWPRK